MGDTVKQIEIYKVKLGGRGAGPVRYYVEVGERYLVNSSPRRKYAKMNGFIVECISIRIYKDRQGDPATARAYCRVIDPPDGGFRYFDPEVLQTIPVPIAKDSKED